MAKAKICSVDGCGKPFKAKGLCGTHHMRLLRKGTFSDAAHRKQAAPGEALEWLQCHVNYESDDCLWWPFARTGAGYAAVTVDGVGKVASREMCIAAHGQPPEPRSEAAHSCGNGHLACVNPKHLRWASRSGNLSDRVVHETILRGQKNPMARLSNADVAEIKVLLSGSSMSQRDIAAIYSVSQVAISRIKRGTTWSWMGGVEKRS